MIRFPDSARLRSNAMLPAAAARMILFATAVALSGCGSDEPDVLPIEQASEAATPKPRRFDSQPPRGVGGGRTDTFADRRNQTRDQILDSLDLSDPVVELDDLLGGGPPLDGIPALTDPRRGVAASASFPPPDARVGVVTIDGETVLYPLPILTRHEIANDTISGVPIAVIYCPLCDSLSVVDRRVGDDVLEFGVSGLLYNSNVVMYDRPTRGLWSQLEMTALTGPHAGTSLTHLPVRLMSFETAVTDHPQAEVLSIETGHQRRYDGNPYERFFTTDATFPMTSEPGTALPKKTLGLGLLFGDRAVFVTEQTAARRLVPVETPNGVVEVRAETGVGMQVLTDLPAGVRAVQTFYYAWSAFHPETEIIDDPMRSDP